MGPRAHLANSVRRTVAERCDLLCSFVGTNGQRCGERASALDDLTSLSSARTTVHVEASRALGGEAAAHDREAFSRRGRAIGKRN